MVTSTKTHQVQVKNAVAGIIGNFIEWFDFIIYGALATIIAAHFFPSENPALSLVATFGAFAAALLFRPLGAFIFGRIGDRKGRRVALSSSLVLMSLATAGIGLLPDFQAIGVLAPILLIVLRCIQGIAIGCEWSGSAVFVVESGSRKQRGLMAGMIPGGAFFGALVGSTLILALNNGLSEVLLSTWVWRIPFLIAVPLGAVGLYIRLKLEDTSSFKAVQDEGAIEKAPIKSAFKHHRRSMIIITVGTAAMGVAGYLINTYMVSYLTATVGLPLSTALITNIFMNAVVIASALLGGGGGRSRTASGGARSTSHP